MSAARRVPTAAAGASPAATAWRTASAVEAAATTCAPGSAVRRKRAHWALACGCETTVSIASSASGRPASRQRWTGWRSSPTITTSSVSNASASSVGFTDPSSAFSIGTSARSTDPVVNGDDRVVQRRFGDELERVGAGDGQERLVADRPVRPQVCDAHQSSVTVRAASSASATRIASSSSGDSSRSPRPSCTCLQYSRAASRPARQESTTPLPAASSRASDVD